MWKSQIKIRKSCIFLFFKIFFEIFFKKVNKNFLFLKIFLKIIVEKLYYTTNIKNNYQKQNEIKIFCKKTKKNYNQKT